MSESFLLYSVIFLLLILLLALLILKSKHMHFTIHKLKNVLGMKPKRNETVNRLHSIHSNSLSKKEIESNHSEILIEGELIDLKNNHVGDVDMLIINSQNETLAIHFPPHLGKPVTHLISKGKNLKFKVHPSRKKMYENFPLYNLTAIKRSSEWIYIDDIKPVPPTGIPIQLDGYISDFVYNKSHSISGFILNNFLVDIPPHFGETITPFLKKDEKINVRGYKRNKNTDFINNSGYDIIRPYSISTNETDYLL